MFNYLIEEKKIVKNDGQIVEGPEERIYHVTGHALAFKGHDPRINP